MALEWITGPITTQGVTISNNVHEITKLNFDTTLQTMSENLSM